jgi:hypothetical protein
MIERTSKRDQYGRSIGRRTALRTLAGALAASGGLGGTTTAAVAEGGDEEGENYAEIEFNNQRSDGTSVEVASLRIEMGGFITIHTWDLIQEQNGRDTIVGVSRYLETGEYENETVPLFVEENGISPAFHDQERLEHGQRLVAVPHRDVNDNGTFDFTDENENPHDIPFTDGSRARTDLPVDGAVNDIAAVAVVPESADGQSQDHDEDPGQGEGRD